MTILISAISCWLKECFTILYWSIFKPFTYKVWLASIHPQLTPTTNPLQFRDEFSSNPLLRKFARQVWWMAVFFSVIALGLIDPPIDNLLILLFIIGWLIGILSVKTDINSPKILLLAVTSILLIINHAIPNIFQPITHIQIDTKTITNLSSIIPENLRPYIFILIGIVSSMVFKEKGVILALFPASTSLVILSKTILSLSNYTNLAYITMLASVIFYATVAHLFLHSIDNRLHKNIAVAFSVIAFIYIIEDKIFLIIGLASLFRVPFWLFECLWLLILYGFYGKNKPAEALQWTPLYADQICHLPLPSLDTMVLAAYRQEPQKALEFLEYLTTSTNQQERSARLTEKIILEEAGQRTTSQEIASLASNLRWIPQPCPEAFGIYLPKLLDIAHGVQTSLDASTAYHQLESLKFPLGKLQELKKSLTFEKSAERASAWGMVINRWLEVLETTRNSLEEAARELGAIQNPYVAGVPLLPAYSGSQFKGRAELFWRVEELALAPHPPILLLLGGRRTGKSSSLNFLPEKMGPEWIPLIVDCQGLSISSNLVSITESLAKAIVHSARMSRNLHLPMLSAADLQNDPLRALLYWMEQAEKILDPDKRFLLCLDEFERLGEVVERTQGDKSLLNFLRHVAQHRHRWVVLFSGVHPLNDLPDYWSDCLINSQTITVSFLKTEEARELILKPIPEFPDIYTMEAVESILHLTHGHPYLVQLLCQLLVERLNETKHARINAADVEAVVPDAFEVGEGFFHEWWRQLKDEEKTLLTRIHRQEDVNPKQHSLALRRLLRREIVTRNQDGGYAFQVPLLERYMALQLGE
ncbi:MAG: hypothetical protein HQL95_04000 [Magnetococcales bacterium]|nr:hypothetical protein [Magnetococcales bacterium]